MKNKKNNTTQDIDIVEDREKFGWLMMQFNPCNLCKKTNMIRCNDVMKILDGKPSDCYMEGFVSQWVWCRRFIAKMEEEIAKQNKEAKEQKRQEEK